MCASTDQSQDCKAHHSYEGYLAKLHSVLFLPPHGRLGLGRRTHESLPPTHRVKCGVDAAGTEAERTSVPEPLEKVLSACQYRSTARG